MPAAASGRGSARIWLLEGEPGELGRLEAMLRERRVETLRCVRAALPAAPAPDAVILALGPDLAGSVARLTASWRGYRPPLVGHAPEEDGLTLSRGLALGCCEVLHDALAPDTVAGVTGRAAELGLLRRELAGRLQLLESFLDGAGGGEEMAPPSAPPALLMLGPASEEQVEIARAVGQARIAYGRHPGGVVEHFDLVVRTRPGAPAEVVPQLLGDGILLATAASGEGEEAVTIGTVGGDGLPVVAPGGDPLRLRMHLRFWIDLARTRRRLRELPDARVHALARDGLTGLCDFAFLASYLEAVGSQGGELPLLAIGLPALEKINRDRGFAAGNRLLREAGRLLRHHCRAADFLARVGGGFLCLPSAVGRETLPAMAARLTAVLGKLPGTPPALVLPASTRRGETATRAIHRVRRELRGELARVA